MNNYRNMFVITINGETFDKVAVETIKTLKSYDVAKVRVNSDGWLIIDYDYGTEVTVLSRESINFTDRLHIKAEITKTAVLFYHVYERSVLCSDGINSGESLYKDSDSDELRLNNVYGYGEIYHRLPVFGTYSWVQVGSYSLRDESEESRFSNEDAVLAVETAPRIARSVISTFQFK